MSSSAQEQRFWVVFRLGIPLRWGRIVSLLQIFLRVLLSLAARGRSSRRKAPRGILIASIIEIWVLDEYRRSIDKILEKTSPNLGSIFRTLDVRIQFETCIQAYAQECPVLEGPLTNS